MTFVLLVLMWLLGITFAISGARHLASPDRLAAVFERRYGFSEHSTPPAIAVGMFELGLGTVLGLSALWAPRLVVPTTGIMCGVLFAYVVHVALARRDEYDGPCGCGPSQGKTTLWHLLRTSGLFAAAAVVTVGSDVETWAAVRQPEMVTAPLGGLALAVALDVLPMAMKLPSEIQGTTEEPQWTS